jgi:iron complex transport system permease protein
MSPRPPYLTRARFVRMILLTAAVLAAAIVASALIGAEHVDFRRALLAPAADNVDAVILLRIRLPRALMGAVVGGALAGAGAVLQALLRNPLAEPHLLGVSGGAAFGGVAALILGGATGAMPAIAAPLGAFAGALTAMLVVYRLGTVHGRLQPYTFLLAGVVCNAFTGALIMALNSFADFFQAHGVLFWLMGSLQAQSYWLLLASAAYVALAIAWLLRHARELNVLSLGEEAAAQLGVHVAATRRIVFVLSSLLVGAAVSVSGMIGFVGLIVPHVARLLIGADYRLLLPASVLLGAAFLVLADTIARSAFGGGEIPVGVVTALCGGPFFIYLLRRQEGRTVE